MKYLLLHCVQITSRGHKTLCSLLNKNFNVLWGCFVLLLLFWPLILNLISTEQMLCLCLSVCRHPRVTLQPEQSNRTGESPCSSCLTSVVHQSEESFFLQWFCSKPPESFWKTRTRTMSAMTKTPCPSSPPPCYHPSRLLPWKRYRCSTTTRAGRSRRSPWRWEAEWHQRDSTGP